MEPMMAYCWATVYDRACLLLVSQVSYTFHEVVDNKK